MTVLEVLGTYAAAGVARVVATFALRPLKKKQAAEMDRPYQLDLNKTDFRIPPGCG
jgi:hypothetical protein